MEFEKEKCDCRWTANNVASIIAAIGSTVAMILGAMNHRAGEENGAKIQAVQSEAETVKADLHKRGDDVDKRLEKVQKTADKTAVTTEKTAVKVGAEK